MVELLDHEGYFTDGEEVYLHIAALTSSCKSAQRDEYG